jgi:hypothetical protein
MGEEIVGSEEEEKAAMWRPLTSLELEADD